MSAVPPKTPTGRPRAALGWELRVAELGGIARRRDLRGFGLSDVDLRVVIGYGSLIRVRQGWYALPGTDKRLVEACRLGGRLACVSALAFHGEPVEGAGATDDGRIHIEVPANVPDPVPRDDRARVRVHWARMSSAGDRAAVGVEDARRQWQACRASLDA